MKKRVPMTVSLPPDLAADYRKLAEKEEKNNSELFREMFKAYKRQSLREEFFELQKYAAERARRKGIYTEEDVDRIVFQGRYKKRSK